MVTFHCKSYSRPIFRSEHLVDTRMIWDLKDYQAECYLISEAIEPESLQRYDTSLHDGWYCCQFIMMRMTTDKFGTGDHLLVYTDSVVEVPEGQKPPLRKEPSGVIRLSARDFDEVIKSGEPDQLQVVKFGAIWCPPCRLMDAVFDRIQKAKDLPNVRLFEVDIDEEQELASRWRFQSIPFTMIFNQGKQVDLSGLGYQTIDGGLVGGVAEAGLWNICQTIQHHVH
jgi:thioredoxin 1